MQTKLLQQKVHDMWQRTALVTRNQKKIPKKSVGNETISGRKMKFVKLFLQRHKRKQSRLKGNNKYTVCRTNKQ